MSGDEGAPAPRVALPDPPLLLITDSRQARGPIPDIVAAALRGGCRWVSLREKEMAPGVRLALLRELVALGREQDARVMVHGDLDAAREAGAGGIHLPAGADPRDARAALGAGALIGISCHAFVEIIRAGQMGADYVTLSPIFVSASKPDYGPAFGLEALARAVRETMREATGRAPVPIVALGGVTAETLPDCLAAGAAGIAVMGEIMRAADPTATTAALLAGFARGAMRDGSPTR